MEDKKLNSNNSDKNTKIHNPADVINTPAENAGTKDELLKDEDEALQEDDPVVISGTGTILSNPMIE